MASTSDGTEPAAASSTTPCPRMNAMASSGVTCSRLFNLTMRLSPYPVKPRLTKDEVRHTGFNVPVDNRDRRKIVRSMGTHQHPKLPCDGEGRPEHETCDYGLFRASDPLGGVVSQAKQHGREQDN